jgi:predicted hydrolase (HD superfamily)
MRRAADELGVDFDAHLQRVIDAMESRKEVLGLEPREAAPDAA